MDASTGPRPPLIETEVVDPSPPGTPPGDGGGGDGRGRRGASGPSVRTAFHPAAATLLLVVDSLWAMAEWAVLSWLVTIPLSFLTVFLPALLVQRRMGGDRLGTALWKALFLGVLAAVPTAITGTPVGLALLAWAGIKRIRR